MFRLFLLRKQLPTLYVSEHKQRSYWSLKLPNHALFSRLLHKSSFHKRTVHASLSRTSIRACVFLTGKRVTGSWYSIQLFPLSLTGSILSNTDLSDLSMVGTCDIFVYQKRQRVMWFARLADSILFIKRVITCHWNGFYENAMGRMFSKMFYCIQYDQSMAEYRNTYHCYVFCYPKWQDISIEGLSVGI